MFRSSSATARVVVVAVFITPGALHAQNLVTLTPPDTPRWDATVHAGWYGASKPGAPTWNDWLDAGVVGASVSYAWTRHFRTELDGSLASEGRVYSEDYVFIPGQAGPVFRTRLQEYRDSTIAASLIYAPLDNRWVQPFIGAGVGAVRERLRSEAPQWIYYGRPGSPVIVPAEPDVRDVRYRVLPHLVGGAKFYVSESAFIRGDVRFGAARDGNANALVRIGFGVDF